MKLDILAFAAHPDDVELSASGTLLKHISMGYTAGIVDLTQGELGSRGTAEIRMDEAEAARQLMGLSARDNLGLRDGFFATGEEKDLLTIIDRIRHYRPEIVLCNAVSDRHPDHGRASELVSRACFLSGLIRIDTGQPHWRPKAVYHYIQDRYHTPDVVVDISGFMQKKIETVLCYKSQFFDPGSSEPETPISSKDFLDFLEARAREMGRQSGFEHGEGFTAERFIGTGDLFTLE